MKFEPENFTFALHILNYFQQMHTILGIVDVSVMLLLESATDRYLQVINPSIYSITWWGWKKTWFWHRTLILKIFENFKKITHKLVLWCSWNNWNQRFFDPEIFKQPHPHVGYFKNQITTLVTLVDINGGYSRALTLYKTWVKLICHTYYTKRAIYFAHIQNIPTF